MTIQVKIPEEISYLKTRQTTALGKVFTVPRGIVRIDIDEQGWGTHGWQVRPPKYQENQKSKFFSDRVDLSDKGPADSLRRALLYMAQNPPTPHVRQYPNNTSKNCGNSVSTGFHGIRLVLRKHKNRNFQEVFVEASNIEKSKASKRFYCGTLNTATEERVAAALCRAVEFREQMKNDLLARRKAQANQALEMALQRDLKKASNRTKKDKPTHHTTLASVSKPKDVHPD